MSKCHRCGSPSVKNTCSKKCSDILRLRNRAIQQLLDYDEKLYGEGYDSTVKRAWVKNRVEEIGQGLQDESLYLFWLKKR